jgi:hypothetical protein
LRSLLLVALVFSAGAAHAAATSHEINIAPVRGYIQDRLVDQKTNTLKVGRALNAAKPGKGITALAVTKATQTLRGMTGFNSGTKAGNYVHKMGAEKVILTASAPGQKVDGIAYESPDNAQQFVLRTGKTGAVIARGNLDETSGKLTFTRSHNGESPAEVNAAK